VPAQRRLNVKVRSIARLALAGALLLGLPAVGPSRVHADDKPADPSKPDPKAEAKAKALQKAKDDMEKDLKAKKVDPVPALAAMDRFATQIGLEVKDATTLVKKIMSKKMPWDVANQGMDDKLRASVDTKTYKIDGKKFQTDFTKWLNEWKPEDKKAPPAAGGTPAPADPKKP
jgi:hypothetical protein